MRWPWSVEPVEHDPSALNRCPQCGHLSGLIDEHWLTISTTRDGAARVTVCSPRCATTWLEAVHRAGVPQ